MFTNSIFALSTVWGFSAISIIRISGSECSSILKNLCGIKKPKNRYAYFAKIKNYNKELIDCGIVIFFKGPNSFTGEDMLELQLHGSPAVIKNLLSSLEDIKNLKPAEPGEFIKRAFLNKKMNLLQVEGTNSLISAETELQRKIAANIVYGETKSRCEYWMEKLINISAMIDALIEFNEEDETINFKSIKRLTMKLIGEIKKSLKQLEISKEINNGINVLILGPPNAGKSTLLNFINKREVAITTPIEGTTRDLISSSIDIGGIKVNFIDSAGIRKTIEPIEEIGVNKTISQVKKVNRVLLVLSPDSLKKGYVRELSSILDKIELKKIIIIFNKSDLENSYNQEKRWQNQIKFLKNIPYITISCVERDIKDNIYKKVIFFITNNFIKIDASLSEDIVFTELRHKNHLKKALKHLQNFRFESTQIDIISEEIRLAIREIENISGNIDFEQKLDVIFKKFCIGK